MDQVINFLDEHGGSVTAIVTVAYVVITLLLLLEARATRASGNVANLDAHPRPYAALNVELVLENYGPAIAKAVRFRRWNEIDGKVVDETDKTQAEPMFPVGKQRRFLEKETLQELADKDAVLHADWRWRDGRRTFGLWTATHHRAEAYRATELRDGFYGGWALRDRDPAIDEAHIRDEIKKARAAVEDIARTLKEPAMAVYLRKMLNEAQERDAAADESTEAAGDP